MHHKLLQNRAGSIKQNVSEKVQIHEKVQAYINALAMVEAQDPLLLR